MMSLNMRKTCAACLGILWAGLLVAGTWYVIAQTPPAPEGTENRPPPDADFGPPLGQPSSDGPGGFGPGGFSPGGRGGPGGPGGMMSEETKLLKQFDQDGNGRLDNEERKAARAHLSQQRGNRGPDGFGGPRGGFGRPGESQEPAQPGIRVTHTSATIPRLTNGCTKSKPRISRNPGRH
jgi:hypothetical protein